MKQSKASRHRLRRLRSRRGSALLITAIILFVLGIGASTYVGSATQTYRTAYRESLEVQTTPLCDAASQAVQLSIWTPFKENQNFTVMDAACTNASVAHPLAAVSGSIPGGGKYTGAVIKYTVVDSYTRNVIIRCVGWMDLNNNGTLDANEPAKTVDVTATYSLQRSGVFDYTYFINNYGWMDGFGPNDLIVNGDMRSNGNFTISNGSPTINGSLMAAQNQQLDPPAAGLVNQAPVKMSNSTYASMASGNSRMRQAYNSTNMGAYGSNNWNNWSSYIFDSQGQIINNAVSGAVVADSTGYKSWTETSYNANPPETLLDPTPTQQIIMPDLSNNAFYQSLSQTYVDSKQTYGDGTANPNYGQGAYVQVWNNSTGKYQTVSTNGVVTGSASLVGSAAHPVLIHGPVTFTQDAVVKGNFSGQGTIYAGRNVHLVGSIIYSNPPNFQGSNISTIDNQNEKADMVALCANGSVIMGDTSQFNQTYPLQFMEPPFTHGRYDDNGNYIPAYNATNRDSTGNMLYQSVLGDNYIHSIASPVNQIDAVLYTNFVGGGDIGTGGSGLQFNGTIISKDEAMVVWSLPMYMNYDGRIRERSLTNTPLIDLQLPRSPAVLQSTWQDRGFSIGSV